MDSWIYSLAEQAEKLIFAHLKKTDDQISDLIESDLCLRAILYNYVVEVCDSHEYLIHERIANSFYERYKDEVGNA